MLHPTEQIQAPPLKILHVANKLQEKRVKLIISVVFHAWKTYIALNQKPQGRHKKRSNVGARSVQCKIVPSPPPKETTPDIKMEALSTPRSLRSCTGGHHLPGSR